MSNTFAQKPRIQSIDLLRGLVMIIMTLDHTRDYFHYDSFQFDPLDLTQTTPLIFLTRFVTHFCAPVFVFLAGTSAYFVGQRKPKKELSIWLMKRGLWLIIVEITIVKFGWAFKLDYSTVVVQVIWALGAGMITLAGFIHLPKWLALSIAIIMMAGHNLMDNVHFEGHGAFTILWQIIHERSAITFEAFTLRIAYPVVPWLGLMVTGYYFGTIYQKRFDREKRLKLLLYSGVSIVVLFILLRTSNLFGDSRLWVKQATPLLTFLSMLDVTKYPPSFLYLLVTIGPSLIFLYLAEKLKLDRIKPLVIVGRVPMFWYIIHLYVIHLTACFAAWFTGYDFSDMFLNGWVADQPALQGYGFSLGGTYLFWIGISLFMYLLSYKYNMYKSANRDKWWLSYV